MSALLVSCHVMSCHVMSCHVMSCHVMLHHVASWHVRFWVPRCVISFRVRLCQLILCPVWFLFSHPLMSSWSCRVMPSPVVSRRVRVVSCRVRSCHLFSCHVLLSCRVLSCLLFSCHVRSSRVMLCRVVLCHFMTCRILSSRVAPCLVVLGRMISCRSPTVLCYDASCSDLLCLGPDILFSWKFDLALATHRESPFGFDVPSQCIRVCGFVLFRAKTDEFCLWAIAKQGKAQLFMNQYPHKTI